MKKNLPRPRPMKSKGFSGEILKRHYDFVAKYQENLKILLDGVGPFDSAILGIKINGLSPVRLLVKKNFQRKTVTKEFNPFEKNKFPKKNADFHPRESITTPGITSAYEYTVKAQTETVDFKLKVKTLTSDPGRSPGDNRGPADPGDPGNGPPSLITTRSRSMSMSIITSITPLTTARLRCQEIYSLAESGE